MAPVLAAQFITLALYVMSMLGMLVLAFLIYRQDSRSATNRLFIFVSFSTCAWLLFMYASIAPQFASHYVWVTRLLISSSTIMNVMFFLFAATIPDREMHPSRGWLWAIGASVVAVVAMNLSSFSIRGVDFIRGVPVPVNGPGMTIFGLYSMAFNIASVVVLIRRLRTATTERRQQLRWVLGGIISMYVLIVGTVFMPVLIAQDVRFVPLAPLYVLLFLALTAYAIAKHRLFNIKIISAQLFSLFLIYVNFLQISSANSSTEFFIQLGIFAITFIFAVLLIRSVQNEAKKSEELRQLAEQLSDANVKLKEADRAKSEFLSIASHELRTPMSVIKGYLSLMMEGAYGQVPGPMRGRVEQIYSMNERLVHMIGNLLNLSRIEKQRVEYTCSKFEVEPLVHQIVEELAFKGDEKSMQIHFTPPTEALPVVYADADKLREIFSNLIDNAIKYSQSGAVEVAVRADEKKESVIFTVADHGIGMTQEEAAKLFTKYYRTENAKRTTATGIGLGLYICFTFIRGMGGEIWIEKTAPQQGTTFAVSIPTTLKGECAKAGMGVA